MKKLALITLCCGLCAPACGFLQTALLLYKSIKIPTPWAMSDVPFFLWKYGCKDREINMHWPQGHVYAETHNKYTYRGEDKVYKGIEIRYYTKKEKAVLDKQFEENVRFVGKVVLVAVGVAGVMYGTTVAVDAYDDWKWKRRNKE